MGFLDESSLRSDPCRRRVINTPVVEYSEGEGSRRSRTIFGFMALNGRDVVMVSDRSKAADMASFLRLIRREEDAAGGGSSSSRPILIVLDNARIHSAELVRVKVAELEIFCVFLPPYSPDLQPIEFGWKDVKREVSGILDFDRAVFEAKGIALKLFNDRKMSYAKHWSEIFICPKG